MKCSTPPPQSLERRELVELEGVQNPKVLVESTKASTHLEVNSIFHAAIVELLWLVYSSDLM
jgi:hypothetical protein